MGFAHCREISRFPLGVSCPQGIPVRIIALIFFCPFQGFYILGIFVQVGICRVNRKVAAVRRMNIGGLLGDLRGIRQVVIRARGGHRGQARYISRVALVPFFALFPLGPLGAWFSRIPFGTLFQLIRIENNTIELL